MIKHQMNDLIIRFKEKKNETKTTNHFTQFNNFVYCPFLFYFFVRSPALFARSALPKRRRKSPSNQQLMPKQQLM